MEGNESWRILLQNISQGFLFGKIIWNNVKLQTIFLHRSRWTSKGHLWCRVYVLWKDYKAIKPTLTWARDSLSVGFLSMSIIFDGFPLLNLMISL
jgi:hypothetical protein